MLLRDYQGSAIEAFLASQLRRKLVVLPTGGGKTVTGLALAKKIGGRCLWLAHREELITQPAKALRAIWPEATHGIVKAERNEYMRQVVFASVQSAIQPKRAELLARQNFDLVVVDEAHHSASDSYKGLLEQLGCMRDDGPQLLGITATPERTDQSALDVVFQAIVFQIGITTLIELGYLVPPTVVERKININLDEIATSRGDYTVKELDTALLQAGIVDEICAAYREHAADRKTLIFTVSVEQAERVAAQLRDQGVAAAAISGETPPETRRAILRKLASGELRVVANCQVLTEGFDDPSVDCVILARPTQSKSLMIQCVGRGLRLHPGKTECRVIDMVGASKRNTLVQAAVLFGLRPDPADEERKRKATELDPFTDPEAYWRQRLLSQVKGVRGAPRSKLRWLPGESGIWLLDAGEWGTVRLVPSESEYRVDVVGIRAAEPSRQDLAGEGVTLDTAQAIAEDYVRRVDALSLSRGDARWRDSSATEAQIKILARVGIKAEGLTKGTASDLITQHQAKRAAEPASLKQIAFLKRTGHQVSAGITKQEAMRLIVRAKASGRA